jgi:mono/diheme cytochrome c family protein
LTAFVSPYRRDRDRVRRYVEQRGSAGDFLEVFVDVCLICHGPEGQGDGEAAPDVERPVADLSGPHVDIHTDGDLYWWIMDGIDPAMPGFESELSEEEAWHLVNYIRSLRDPVEEHEMHMGASD